MRQLSRRAAVGLELLVLPARSDREGVHGLTAAFSRREAPGEREVEGLRAFAQSLSNVGLDFG